MRKKILLRGPLLTKSGYGEHARLVLRSLRKNVDEIDIYVEPLNWGQTGWLSEDTEEKRYIDGLVAKTQLYQQSCAEEGIKNKFDASVQVTIPNEWQPLAPINIGVTAGTETTAVSVNWLEKCNQMHKVIVPSEHSKHSIASTVYTAAAPDEETKLFCMSPIDVVGYPVKKNSSNKKLSLNLEYDFNFLAVAQWGPRKNLEATIRWFVEEFIDQEVGLVLKCSRAKNNVIDRNHCTEIITSILSNYEERKCKVYLLHGDMSEEEINSLYNEPKIKALISTSHGEGYGLPIFEAAYNELPVVVPDWGGQVDFLYKPKEDKKGKIKKKGLFAKVDYNLGPIQKEAIWEPILIENSNWCYPKQGSFKMKLREVFKDYKRFKKQSKELSSWIHKEFSEEKIYDQMFDSIYSVIEENQINNNEIFIEKM